MNRDLHQYFTPTFAAELLVQRHFADLGSKDCVVEPSCGDGRQFDLLADLDEPTACASAYGLCE